LEQCEALRLGGGSFAAADERLDFGDEFWDENQDWYYFIMMIRSTYCPEFD